MVNVVVTVTPPEVPAIVIEVVPVVAVNEALRVRTELLVAPAGGVTGLGVKPPETPAGNPGADKVTGALKPPTDCTVTVADAELPRLITRVLGLVDRLNICGPITVKVTSPVLVSPALVPVTAMTLVPTVAVAETVIVSSEVMVPPTGGVTGLELKAPEIPDGNEGVARVTGELKPPMDSMVTMTFPVPPWLRERVSGATDRLKEAAVITVNGALAAFPVLPTTMIV